MTRRLVAAVVAATFVFVGCGSPPQQATGPAAPTPRRTVVWLGDEGLTAVDAAGLAARGVDQVVVRRGSASIAGGAPVLRLETAPPVSGQVPAAIALRLEGVSEDLDPGLADLLWRGLAADLGGAVPAELLLDLPRTSVALAGVIERLAAVSRVPVVPVLLPEQLEDEGARAVVRAARGAVLLAYGTLGAVRRSAVAGDGRLADRIAAIANLGTRVRAGIVIEPLADPELPRFTDGVGGLVADRSVQWSIGARFERSMLFRKAVSWNGRAWAAGERASLQWFDAPRVHAALAEVGRLLLPEIAGWDLIALPPRDRAVGLTRDALLAYLAGAGPAPSPEVTADRNGTSLTATLSNPGPFTSAFSGYDNWIEIAVEGATLVADNRGDFDRIALGALDRNGSWRRANGDGVTAVRFSTALVGPGSAFTTGSVRLTRRDARVTVRWQIMLSTGEEVRGQVAVPG